MIPYCSLLSGELINVKNKFLRCLINLNWQDIIIHVHLNVGFMVY